MGNDSRRAKRLSLRTLSRIVAEANAAKDLDEMLRVMVEHIHQAMNVDVCSIYLTDEQTGRHTLSATVGLRKEAVDRLVLGPKEGLIGLVASQMQPLNIGDCSHHPRFKYIPLVGEEDFNAFLGVPIIFQGALLGVLVVQHRQSRRFTEQDVSFAVTLATQLASHIAFAKLTKTVVAPVAGESEGQWLDGLAAAPGIGIGTAVVLYELTAMHTIPDRVVTDTEAEKLAFVRAVAAVEQDLRELSASHEGHPPQQRELLEAYSMILTSNELVDAVLQSIDNGTWAPAALRTAVEELACKFDIMEDPYLCERGRDIRDLGRRVMDKLLEIEGGDVTYPQNTILVGTDLSAIDLIKVPTDRLRGAISERGSAFSHLAIVARTLGIPAVTGLGDLPLMQLDRREIIADGYRGRLYVNPNATVRREFRRLAREEQELNDFLEAFRDKQAITPDGERVTVLVNAGLAEDLPVALNAGAEGVGLYRTELLFMTQDRFPTEDQQVVLYRRVLEAFHPRPVTFRTLDIGGDKPLPYFPVCETNPFLGWRGIRICLDHPEIFEMQLSALLRASEGFANARLLIPMVSGSAELYRALTHVDKVYHALLAEGRPLDKPTVGVMIEVPSAVYQAELFARHVDFLSIGTNDLTQYLLAVDRDNERVAKLFDALHPAVLQAMFHVIRCGKQRQIPVTICGEVAGDPAAALLLLGMGAEYLSVNAGDIPKIKWLITKISRAHAQELLHRALDMEAPDPIREMLRGELEQAGLGALIRPGK